MTVMAADTNSFSENIASARLVILPYTSHGALPWQHLTVMPSLMLPKRKIQTQRRAELIGARV
jgi:hypothetical protein